MVADDDEMNETAMKVLAKSGPWAVLAAVLVAFVLMKIDPAIEALKAQHEETRKEDAADALKIANVMGQVLMAIERSNYLERRNCINTAKTAQDRDACAKDRD